MILSEQAARQELENIVLSLQEQVRALSAQSPRISSMNSKLDPNTAFSTFEHDDSSDDGRYVNDEVFQTPNEEMGNGGHFGDEIFGDVLRNSASDEVKGAPRTLSLSQITLGAGQRHAAVNF
jgi:hypothetical protein